MIEQFKRYAVWYNLALFTAMIWYIMTQLILTLIWRNLWH